MCHRSAPLASTLPSSDPLHTNSSRKLVSLANQQMAYASNVWVRNVRIINADSGIFLSWVHRSSILGGCGCRG